MNNKEQGELLNRITIIPGMMGGKPTIRGMRFPVADILEMLSSGMTNEEILEQHPALEKEDIPAALLYASLRIKTQLLFMQLDWEIWLDCHISPIIGKWLKDKTGWNIKTSYMLKLGALKDVEIYAKAKSSGKVILISKYSDLPDIVQQKGTPPKVISIKIGNSDNRLLWQLIENKIEKAVRLLTDFDIDIIEIE